MMNENPKHNIDVSGNSLENALGRIQNHFVTDGDIVEYGAYPRSRAALLEEQIQQLVPVPGHENYRYFEGALYTQYDNEWFMVEPIRWRMLRKEGNMALLASEELVDARAFDVAFTDFTSATIRTWLNGIFSFDAFLDGGKRLLKHEEAGCNITLLSEEEAHLLDDRRCKPTEYARKRGALINKDGYGWYYLRTERTIKCEMRGNVFTSTDVLCVENKSDEGNIGGHDPSSTRSGVRPVILIQLP